MRPKNTNLWIAGRFIILTNNNTMITGTCLKKNVYHISYIKIIYDIWYTFFFLEKVPVTMIMEKRNITMQIKEMANFIMYVLVELVFSDSYMYFNLNLNAIIIKLHDEAIYIYSF